MKIRYWMALASMACLAAVGGPAVAQEPIRIGMILALSGPAAAYGVPAEKAMRMLVDGLGPRGIDGHPIQLTIYDTEGNATKAVQLFRRLVDNDNVHIVLGPSTSGESLAIVPLANQMEVPNITNGGAEPVTKPTTPWVFATSPTDRLVVENILTDFREKKLTKIALLYSADAYGQSGGTITKELAGQYGITLVADESYAPQDTNMSPQLLRARNAQPQALLIWGSNPGPSIVMRNAVELGFKLPMYVSYASGSHQFLAQTGPAAEGSFVPTFRTLAPESLPNSDPLKVPLSAFVKKYKETLKIDPDLTSGHSYDVLLWIADALKKVKGPISRKSLRDGLEMAKFDGANGPRAVTPQDHRGLDKTSVVMMQAKGGRWAAVPK